jgi:hypothetical protein
VIQTIRRGASTTLPQQGQGTQLTLRYWRNDGPRWEAHLLSTQTWTGRRCSNTVTTVAGVNTMTHHHILPFYQSLFVASRSWFTLYKGSNFDPVADVMRTNICNTEIVT